MALLRLSRCTLNKLSLESHLQGHDQAQKVCEYLGAGTPALLEATRTASLGVAHRWDCGIPIVCNVILHWRDWLGLGLANLAPNRDRVVPSFSETPTLATNRQTSWVFFR